MAHFLFCILNGKSILNFDRSFHYFVLDCRNKLEGDDKDDGGGRVMVMMIVLFQKEF